MTIENCNKDTFGNVRTSDCPQLDYVRKASFSKPDFSFADKATAKQKSNWDTEIANGNIFVFPLIEAIEDASTEASTTQLINVSVRTDSEKKKIRYTFYQSDCVYAEIIKFDRKRLRIFEFYEGDYYKAIETSDLKIKGQDVYVQVSIPKTATTADIPVIIVDVDYLQPLEYVNTPSILKLDSTFSSLEGAAAVSLVEVGTSLATQINVDATLVCGGDDVTTLVISDFIVKDGAGAVVTPTSITYNATSGLYEIIGTGFANGFTVELVPKITPEIIYTGDNVLTVANI